MAMTTPNEYINQVLTAVQTVDQDVLLSAIDLLEQAYDTGRSVFLIGNGGSAANASHFAEDLCKGALSDSNPKRFRVLSLTDNTPFITAIANDIGYADIFEFQLRQFAEPEDVLIAISGSGNSSNIIKAVEYARSRKIKIIGFTGFDGGKLRKLSDIPVHVPLDHMCQSEAVHSVLSHLIVDLLKERISKGGAE